MYKINIHRQIYFDKTIHRKSVKDCISGDNEEMVIEVLETINYFPPADYFRQHPIGNRFVLDFAFLKEQIAIEIDGKNHDYKKQKDKDKERDKFLLENNWITLRIKDKEFFGSKRLFYKFLIKEMVETRRKQFKDGKLYPLDIPDFNDYD